MIKFHNVLDVSASKKLNSHDMRKLAVMLVVLCVSFVLAGVVFVLIDELGLGIFIIAFGLLFPLLLTVSVKKKQNDSQKSHAILNTQTVQDFEFYDDHYTSRVNSGDMYNALSTARYCYLFKVVETKTHYFLYVSDSQAEVVDKLGLVEGSLQELNDIFSRNLGEKFHACKGK